jgi:TRAP-type mannitol/chloroaromatic compound transport system permease small subunit
MNPIKQIFKEHLTAVFFYALYILWWAFTLNFVIGVQYAIKHNEHVMNDSGLVPVFTFFIGIVFIIVNLLNILFHKTQYKFYLWLCLAVLIPLAIIANI